MIIVIGAGAAGLMAAIFAAGGRTRVTLLERTADGGRKILISGGGRCNILPSIAAPERFVTDSSPAVMRRFLRSWPLAAQREFFETEVGIPLALEESTGKLFPVSNRARDVRDRLVAAARDRGVEIRCGVGATGLERVGGMWRITTTTGDISASCVVLATGGLSVPATGSDGTGLRIVERLGHRVHAVYPALAPLTCEPARFGALSGVSLRVRMRAQSDGRMVESSGGFLFTHRGYSGPAVLDVSHIAVRSRMFGDEPAVLRVQWSSATREEWEQHLSRRRSLVLTIVASALPQRLAAALLEDAAIPLVRRTFELRREERVRLIDRLTAFRLPWTGDEGFRKAEVTGGGVALDEVDPRTLESRRQPGLFLCGEMLDAFGPIGGHNFQWAWATGRLAGMGARSREA